MNFLINYEKTNNNKQFSKHEVFDKLKTLYVEKTTNLYENWLCKKPKW
ncbi:hypothetical protein [Spiroplasma sp. Moj]